MLDLGGSRRPELNNHVKMGGQQVGTDGGTISELTPHTLGLQDSRTSGLQDTPGFTAGCPVSRSSHLHIIMITSQHQIDIHQINILVSIIIYKEMLKNC